MPLPWSREADVRQFPDLWKGAERLNWLFVLQELLGEESLSTAPTLLAGMASITRAAPLRAHAGAIQNLRHLSLDYASVAALRHGVERYLEHHYKANLEPLYEVDPETLRFQRPPTLLLAPELTTAREALTSALELRVSRKRRADPTREMAVRFGTDGLPLPVLPLGFSPAEPKVHDVGRQRGATIEVAWTDLLDEARSMDERDRNDANSRPGNWERILSAAELLHAEAAVGLQNTDTLRLDGVQHLIGLPGSGKTTLLVVLARMLARQGRRIALILPSIEVCRQYLALLERYGVDVGLLVGQSDLTRRRHMDRIADTISAGPHRGFGHTLPGADRFAANCVLAGFARDGTTSWPFGSAPCTKVIQAGSDGSRPEQRLCPLWGACGRNRAPRELPTAQVWLGHVRSMDTAVPAAVSDRRLTYYELIARTFDLVVFDEADLVQRNLDEYGANILSLSGTADSMHRVVQEQVQTRFARGENHRLTDAEVNVYTRELAEFGNQTNYLVHCLNNLDRSVSRRHEGQLLTSSRILGELMWSRLGDSEDEATRDQHRRRIRAVVGAWDRASRAVMLDRTGQAPAELEDHDGIEVSGLQSAALQAWETELRSLFRRHLAAVYTRMRAEVERQIMDLVAEFALEGVPSPTERGGILLLLHVTFVIRAYQRIVPGTRTMVAEGLLHDQAVSSAVSDALRRYCPENLLGRMSGVRFEFDEAQTTRANARNVRLSYVSFTAAPRMLMTRLPNLFAEDDGRPGPAVLLTSATSYMEDSPAFHVNAGLPFVLRKAGDGFGHEGSRLAFSPIADPAFGGRPLRYSGAGKRAEANLLAMVDHLVGRGLRRAEVLKAARNFDVTEGPPRKAALVVNSYAQAQLIKEHIDRRHPEVGRRTVAVVRAGPDVPLGRGFVTAAQVPDLGDDPDWDLLVFPLGALGRGTNVVFSSGPRARHAAIGSIWFLTRPHPPVGDLGLLESLAGQASERFDRLSFPADASVQDLVDAHAEARRSLYGQADRLMREPLMASRLGELFRPFTANLMVEVLQTIGRGMRGHRPVQAFFVDAAWAPRSAEDETDATDTSMLVQMVEILADCVSHPDPAKQAIYRELYMPFFSPMSRMEGVNLPDELRARLAALEL